MEKRCDRRPEKHTAFKIDDSSGIPVWIQVRRRLIYLIASGEYKPGDKLPTVRDLAVELDINYNTVNKVYQDLERDGFISTKRGRGTFVSNLSEANLILIDNKVDLLCGEFVQSALDFGMSKDEIVTLVKQKLVQQIGGRQPVTTNDVPVNSALLGRDERGILPSADGEDRHVG